MALASFSGDLAAIHQTRCAETGQIAVARVKGEAAAGKRFSRRQNRVQLQPAHPDFQTLAYDLRKDEIAIAGRVVGVLRRS